MGGGDKDRRSHSSLATAGSRQLSEGGGLQTAQWSEYRNGQSGMALVALVSESIKDKAEKSVLLPGVT